MGNRYLLQMCYTMLNRDQCCEGVFTFSGLTEGYFFHSFALNLLFFLSCVLVILAVVDCIQKQQGLFP